MGPREDKNKRDKQSRADSIRGAQSPKESLVAKKRPFVQAGRDFPKFLHFCKKCGIIGVWKQTTDEAKKRSFSPNVATLPESRNALAPNSKEVFDGRRCRVGDRRRTVW